MLTARELSNILVELKYNCINKNEDEFYENFYDFIISCVNHFKYNDFFNEDNELLEILKMEFYSALVDQSKKILLDKKKEDYLSTLHDINDLYEDLWQNNYLKRKINQDEIIVLDYFKTTQKKELFIDYLKKLLEPIFNNDEVEEILKKYQNLDQESDDEQIKQWLDNEFKKIIGLDNIKNDIYELLNFIIINKERKAAGLKSSDISMHMVFSGNPGTGKTTIARMIGKLYKKIGLLQDDDVIEVSREDLVAEYVGQTAIKTKKVLESANNKVLFIDEAYTLSDENDSFGKESINTILKYMEDNRDNLVVIVAGYENEMERFLKSNPGLESRFNKKFHFKNYNDDELMQLLISICDNNNYTIKESDKKKILAHFKKIDKNNKSFSNGRFIRNLFERAIMNQANRLSKNKNNNNNLEELLYDDFELTI